MPEMKKLLIAVLGCSDSGKSTCWTKLFWGYKQRTGKNIRFLELDQNLFTQVFIVNGSPQERCMPIDEIIPQELNPNIVLCSIQYPSVKNLIHSDNCENKDNGFLKTFEYFAKREYEIIIFWLKPSTDPINAISAINNKGWELHKCQERRGTDTSEKVRERLIKWVSPQ